ncbi:hypothetical protein CgunFtcFv8_024520 [Champsocephalus gunnari]|uniref:Uncharacterized protein n=1 Tax=Champsocephalus gunnari TaxID=52237 RepID=A0AAN8DEM8_CHAGU|nr:hypothetical protein CgunFtcFv8_024520 [Champsocephalus gunnari]
MSQHLSPGATGAKAFLSNAPSELESEKRKSIAVAMATEVGAAPHQPHTEGFIQLRLVKCEGTTVCSS